MYNKHMVSTHWRAAKLGMQYLQRSGGAKALFQNNKSFFAILQFEWLETTKDIPVAVGSFSMLGTGVWGLESLYLLDPGIFRLRQWVWNYHGIWC